MYRLRPALWALSLAAMLWFLYELAGSRPAERAALPALAGFLWAVLLLGIAYGLSNAPPAVQPGDGMLRRLAKRARRTAFVLTAFLALGLGGLIVYLTWRSLALALR